VPDLDRTTLIEIYRRMLRIRHFELVVQKMAKRGELPGSIHLSLGQEGQVVGSCMPLGPGDYMTGTHRSHGHPIGKGAALRGLMAEILGRRTGVCKGKGGSMHLADFSVGSLGESGVIGSGIPVATGAALGAKTRKSGAVALTFFGDGGANQGVLYECLNMAALWKLPVIYLLENNMYASMTPQKEVTAQTDVFRRAEGFGVRAVMVDGQDVLEVYRAVDEAVSRARAGAGPTFVEVRTYRFSDHSENLRFAKAYAGATRDEQEQAAWKARDPLDIMRQHLVDREIAHDEIATLEAGVVAEVEVALNLEEDRYYLNSE
jgi:pyruvate dehydrogenase E1 component alpha subunit